jgi:hypothetical protein
MKRCCNFKVHTISPIKLKLEVLNPNLIFNTNTNYLNFKIDNLEDNIVYNTTVENNLEFTTKVNIFKLCSKDVLYGNHPKFRCGIIYSTSSYYIFITSEGEEFIVNDGSLLIVRD